MPAGNRITKLRKQMGLTAEALAERVGCSPATMYRYENGTTKRLPADIAVALALALGTSVDYLNGTTDDPRPDPHMSELEQRLSREAILDQMFHRMLFCAQIEETFTEDGDVVLSNGKAIDPDFVHQTMLRVLDYFTFLVSK